jgi:hypothetical protein
MRGVPPAALLPGQPDARPPAGEVLRAAGDQLPRRQPGRTDQGVHAARDQRVAALHDDGRLITLDDTVEFFNLVLGTNLSAGEKADLLAFLYTL